MYQKGEVSIVRCKSCGEIFPVFTFVGDTDMSTIGCVSLTGPDNNIVLTEQLLNESNIETESRIGGGFKIIHVRYQETQSAKGLLFQKYRKSYKPPIAIYTCIACGSDSEAIKTETKQQFLSYGKIRVFTGS